LPRNLIWTLSTVYDDLGSDKKLSIILACPEIEKNILKSQSQKKPFTSQRQNKTPGKIKFKEEISGII
jgi:hypothetical protein